MSKLQYWRAETSDTVDVQTADCLKAIPVSAESALCSCPMIFCKKTEAYSKIEYPHWFSNGRTDVDMPAIKARRTVVFCTRCAKAEQ